MGEDSFESARNALAAEIDVGGGDIGDLINGSIAETVNDLRKSPDGAPTASPVGSVLLNCMLALDSDGGHLDAARDLFLGAGVDADELMTDSELAEEGSHGEGLLRSAFEKAYELRVRREIKEHATQITQLVVLWMLKEPEASATQDFGTRLRAALGRVADVVPATASINDLVKGITLADALGPASAALSSSREMTERAQGSAEYQVISRNVSPDMLEFAYLWNPSRGLLVSKANDPVRPYETFVGTFPERLGEYAPDPRDENLCWPALVRQLTPPKSSGAEDVARSALTGDGWLMVAKRFEDGGSALPFGEAVGCAKALSVIRHDCERAGWSRREVMDGWNGVREDAGAEMVDAVARAHAQLVEASPSQVRALMPCRGRLLRTTEEGYEAIDNSGGDFLTERFANKAPARSWLMGAPIGEARLVDGMLASLALHGLTMEDLGASTKASPVRIEGSLAKAFGNAIGGSDADGSTPSVELPDGFPVDTAWIIAHDKDQAGGSTAFPWVTCVISGGLMRLDRFRSLTCAEYALSQATDAAECHAYDDAWFSAPPSPVAQPIWDRLCGQRMSAWNPDEQAAVSIGDVFMGPQTASLWLGAKATGIVLGQLTAEEEGIAFDIGQLVRSKAHVLVQNDEAHADDWARLGSLIESDSRWIVGGSEAIADVAVSDYAKRSLAGRLGNTGTHLAPEAPRTASREPAAVPSQEPDADTTIVIRAQDQPAPAAGARGYADDWSDLD